ncbi:MAG: metallophosphoesterase [Melioribacteraceae bacterium]|nr:metallophosphoesterase [Melioribacteraceae bacterium]MCF8356464.1 metallophosphoesterase [Melioribacteraceae bacterium]MCF8395852.1 metallophosphoesterase [Melioribacteraceae bacterium]MCF8420936.1 metallophosphoesterase [Melioribacteraceae bacterium]
MRIFHISDLHICSKFRKENIVKTRRLLEYGLKRGFDHLVITGDISDNAQEKDFNIFRKMLQTLGLLDSQKTSIVIGNHDIFGGVQTAIDVVSFPQKCSKTNFEEMTNSFISYFQELFIDCYFPAGNNFFPYAKRINDFLFIGINSIDHYSRFRNPFASNGKVQKAQRNDLLKIFKLDSFKSLNKIVLTHHHFYKNNQDTLSIQSGLWNRIEKYTMKLRNKKRLINIFNEYGVKAVMHGHSHENRHYSRKNISFVNGGGTFDFHDPNKVTAIFIDLSSNKIDVKMEPVLIFNKKSKPISREAEISNVY